MSTDEPPEWYDESKLVKAFYAPSHTGWVIDLGDGTCRYANDPFLGEDDGDNPQSDLINQTIPRWGDRVPLIQQPPELPIADSRYILERYVP